MNLFKAATPHEQYQRKLINAGLDQTAMGSQWIKSAAESFTKAIEIKIPYQETGYFAADKITAATFKFDATKGEKLKLALTKKPVGASQLYLELYQLKDDGSYKTVAFADTLNSPLEYEIGDTGTFLIRLQPELLQSLQYTLEIATGPSLAFPTTSKKSSSIKSYWGDGRDNNARKHEGVDIFGSFRSPVLASAPGTVTRVNENNLGGKVVWLKPDGKDYNLYYAHLDEQLATAGKIVKIGDTIGLMGNTGNAKTTPTHLHFGIYTYGGAVNPLPFINPLVKNPPSINSSVVNLNKTLRTAKVVNFYAAPYPQSAVLSRLKPTTILHIGAATGNYYKAELPDGSTGFVQGNQLDQVERAIKVIKIEPKQQLMYDLPNTLAATKKTLQLGERVNVLGSFGDFELISDEYSQVGWIVR
ncbi:M23 family metallopeptidase [Pedobacter sandarakinus]|uniref:M23 family metallopeptidase n=1 Tax=Pedobacter sandarakinus TaxID=353156 RepID=UPI002247C910|nr:M23 family metallopeptidase [Pedobacter sandarakinus]MCX2573052.1 M23 family metallopeptidase [Pedobacter sandarakinus]